MTTVAAPPILPSPVQSPPVPTPAIATPTATQVPAPSRRDMVRRFTVEEYHRLIADGFFVYDDRYELLEGLIVAKMPRDPLHDALIALGRRLLDALLPTGWHVRVQSAVTLGDSEPEPDLAVVRGVEVDYVARHPGPGDAALLVEVANSSLADDRAWKGLIYARAGFPVYWIINLGDRRIEVYTDPSGPDSAPAYRRREDFTIGQSVPLVIGGQSVEPIVVEQMFPPQA